MTKLTEYSANGRHWRTNREDYDRFTRTTPSTSDLICVTDDLNMSLVVRPFDCFSNAGLPVCASFTWRYWFALPEPNAILLGRKQHGRQWQPVVCRHIAANGSLVADDGETYKQFKYIIGA